MNEYYRVDSAPGTTPDYARHRKKPMAQGKNVNNKIHHSGQFSKYNNPPAVVTGFKGQADSHMHSMTFNLPEPEDQEGPKKKLPKGKQSKGSPRNVKARKRQGN